MLKQQRLRLIEFLSAAAQGNKLSSTVTLFVKAVANGGHSQQYAVNELSPNRAANRHFRCLRLEDHFMFSANSS